MKNLGLILHFTLNKKLGLGHEEPLSSVGHRFHRCTTQLFYLSFILQMENGLEDRPGRGTHSAVSLPERHRPTWSQAAALCSGRQILPFDQDHTFHPMMGNLGNTPSSQELMHLIQQNEKHTSIFTCLELNHSIRQAIR